MHIRKAHVAGSFYDGNRETLTAYVQEQLQCAKLALGQKTPSAVDMVLLPHAGHFYCGHVIAQTLAHVHLPKTLFILGPNHTGQGTSTTRLAVWHEGHWQSPLGDIPIATKLAQKLLDSNAGFEADKDAHAHEHSLEVLMPFLQEHVPNFHMVPICVGNHNFDQLQAAGLMLAKIMNEMRQQGQDVSIVLSSDMHHFSSHERTLELDEMALKALIELDPLQLARTVTQHSISMCGVCPAIVALFACKALGAKKCNLVTHTTSYEKGKDIQRTVGYAGLFVPKNTC